ncbi:cytochrome P450 [Phenylobacterium sp. LjRoot219]|uniref:cytochrome P450 n=1 Tax=Phenylobacterium sp. LjRoot219 TaxID=3342283 RepID=UPI003ECD9155
MQSAAELDLPHLAMEDPAFAVDPFAQFDAARARHPWLAKATFGYVVTEYEAIKDLLSMDERFRTAHEGVVQLMDAEGTAWGRFQREQILALSGDSHKRIRDVLAPMFTPRAANEHRQLMRQVVSDLLDEWAPKGAFDFEEFASFFPVTVMCSLIGASPSELPRLRSSLEALGLSFNLIPDFLPKLEQGMEILDAFVRQLVADRRAGRRPGPQRDLLDALVEASDAGDLSDDELYNLLVFLFVAGYDTSKNVLTLIMHVLMDRPEDYVRCAEDRAFCGKVLEETLRYHNPATISRLTDEDLVYRDVVFPKDTMLFFPVSVASRDPKSIPEPESFQPERTHDNRHMAFGRGMHICLGQFIARAQIEEGLHLIAQRITAPKLAGPVGRRPFPGVWGLRGLPIVFTPAPRPEPQPATASEA